MPYPSYASAEINDRYEEDNQMENCSTKHG